ncbi:MAG: putative Ig domain-containing protein [Pseudomonadota bacterium]
MFHYFFSDLHSRIVLTLLILLSLVACGGGSSGKSSASITTSTSSSSINASSSSSSIATAPSDLSYLNLYVYTFGEPITPLIPTVTGTVIEYKVSPALPAGLSLNSITGEITGTPTETTAATIYTVMALNSGGTGTFELGLKIILARTTVTITYDIKKIILNWTPVTGATYYQIFKNNEEEPVYTQIGENQTATLYSDTVAVHLIDWLNTSYKVIACDNAENCTESNIINAQYDKTIGYLKASNADAEDFFGYSVALSADGNTLAVGAEQENSGAIAVNGDQTDNSISWSGAVYIFIRSAGGAWSQQAYLKASNTSFVSRFGSALALSADGNTLVVGAREEGHTDNQGDSPTGSGAVYVYTRSNQEWSHQAYMKASNSNPTDYFGSTISLSADGNILAVGAFGEDSFATGIDGDQSDNSALTAGAAYVYTRSENTWLQKAYIKASNTRESSFFGSSVALSADGKYLAVGAYCESSTATGIDGSANCAGAVYIYTQVNNIWSQQSFIKASNAESGDLFGWSVALSANGNTLAVGAMGEQSAATGTNGDQADNTKTFAGAAYIFFRSTTSWSQESYIKASNTLNDDRFGTSIALSADGNTMAVGANYANNNKGAAYIYLRSNNIWQQKSLIKASNYGSYGYFNYLFFGDSLALSADGNTLAVGAHGESSTAVGINEHNLTYNSIYSGAVYLY